MLEVRQTEWKGRGVFTTEDIAEDDHVESSPILLLEPTATEEQVAEIGIGDNEGGGTVFTLSFPSEELRGARVTQL